MRPYLNRDQVHARIYRDFLVRLSKDARVALTITFKESALPDSVASASALCEKTTQHLLRRINKRVFRHGVRRKDYRIASVAVLEAGTQGGRLHIHLALGLPPTHSLPDFMRLVSQEIKRCGLIARQLDIQPVRGAGWAGYLSKSGLEGLLLSCCREAKP